MPPGDPAPEGDPSQSRDRATRVAALTAYFAKHLATFTRASLTEAAMTAGYASDDIDAAWASISWGSAEAAARSPSFGVAAAVALIFIVGTYAGTIGLASSVATRTLALPGFGLAIVAGALAWAALRGSNPAVARGIGCGIVIAVAFPAMLILVVLGMCIAAGYQPLGVYDTSP